MRTLAIICLVSACALGCGKADRLDNAHIQTPNDQPIGAPVAREGKPATRGGAHPSQLETGSAGENLTGVVVRRP